MSRLTPGAQTFDSFASEKAYQRVNEQFVHQMFANLPPADRYQLLDIAAATGMMTRLAHSQAAATHAEIDSVLIDIDLSTLVRTRDEHPPPAAKGYVAASAESLPLREGFDLAIFANSIHLLSGEAKLNSLSEAWRVLRPGGVLGINSAFYDGAYPETAYRFTADGCVGPSPK
jgi:ubiquinone/menaquinone biosynthesis C-methylase UbiE